METKTLTELAVARGIAHDDRIGHSFATGYLGSLLATVEQHLRAGDHEMALAAIDSAREHLGRPVERV